MALPAQNALTEAGDTSPLIRRVLAEAGGTDGGSIVTVGDFMAAVVRVGSNEKRTTSAQAIARAMLGEGYRVAPRPHSADQQALTPSAGLIEAFRSARQIRRAVPGRDAYIGLRHVLAAILTSHAGTPLGDEFKQFLSANDVDASLLRHVLEADVLAALEPQESADAWQRVFHPALVKAEGSTVVEAPSDSAAGLDVSPTDDQPSPGPSTPIAAPDEPPASADDQGQWRRAFAVASADDPLDPSIKDFTGAQREAEAFAMLVAAKSFSPPMAIGVFGAWGAGKSFFLRLVREQIGLIAGGAGEDDPTFYKDVVSINFNAWHYAETNLWASLVDHVFTELDKWPAGRAAAEPQASLLESLSSSRALTLESAQRLVASRREQQDAFARYHLAKNELDVAQSTVDAKVVALANAAWQKTWAGLTDKARIKKAASQLGLGDVTESAEDLAKALDQLDLETSRLGFARSPLWRVAANGGVLIVTVTSMLVLPPLWGWVSNKFLGVQGAVTGALGGLVAPMVAAFGYASHVARNAVQSLSRARPLLAEVQAQAHASLQADLQPIQTELEGKSAAAAEAKLVFERANERLAEAASDYQAGTGRARLMNFVRQRVIGEAYGRHLGYIAAIRRDFESLSALMVDAQNDDATDMDSMAHQTAEIARVIEAAGSFLDEDEQSRLRATGTALAGGVRPFRRIVLFIDDLDRCPPAKVIEVLQAIHLLLAFPLFVVFVAVDVRWLEKSLRDEYSGLISAPGGDQATPFDYLEKIFQIPYWVRPLDPISAAGILQDRMAANEPPATDVMSIEGASPRVLPRPDPVAAATEEAAAATTTVPPDVQPERITFTSAEAAYVEALASVLSVSPRRLLRFINTYSLLKASLPAHERRDLVDREFPAVLSLLAIAVATGEACQPFFKRLREPDISLELLMVPDVLTDNLARARGALGLYAEQPTADVEVLRRHLTLVERFSFNGFSR